MQTNDRRRFTISDGMILVATTALALVDLDLTRIPGESAWNSTAPKLTWACLLFTLALVSIRLRRPRPGRDDLWRQPGWVACVSVAITLTIIFVQGRLTIAVIMARPNVDIVVPSLVFQESLDRLPLQATLVVIAAWAVLALSRRWKAEAGWIDRAGRAIGVSWLAISLANWCMPWFD